MAFCPHGGNKQHADGCNIESGLNETDETEDSYNYSKAQLEVTGDTKCSASINEDSSNVSYKPIWKYTNNSSIMKYEWIRKLRGLIMLDLKRHFGREVLHDRLFSCLSMQILI